MLSDRGATDHLMTVRVYPGLTIFPSNESIPFYCSEFTVTSILLMETAFIAINIYAFLGKWQNFGSDDSNSQACAFP